MNSSNHKTSPSIGSSIPSPIKGQNMFQSSSLIKKQRELAGANVKTEQSPQLVGGAANFSSRRKNNSNVVKMSYIVDQVSGPYFTIQSAIDKAKSGSIIKIHTGLYKENLVIKGKSLSLEARDINSEVYILGSKGPTLLIDKGPTNMLTKQSNNNFETYGSQSGTDRNSESQSDKQNFIEHFNKDSKPVNRKFLHSKTEVNPQVSASHLSDSEDSSDYMKHIPENVIGTPGAQKFIRKVNPGLKKTVKHQLRNLKNSMKKINEQLANTHTVNIQGLRLTHKGSINKRFLQTNKGINTDVLKDNKQALLANFDNYHIQFERVDFSTTTDSVIMVKNGELIIKKCLINLNMLTRESQLVTCSVIADSGTTLSIESCEFRGSKHFNTIGVVLRNANMLMKNTSISNFMSGGIIMYTKPDNIVKIYKSRIRNNKYFGIQILGNSSSPSIQYCTIENNSCVGIQVCAANKCNIRKNIIILNKNGIEVISADPLIYENEINQNYANGIMVKSLENLVSLPKIQGNDIFSNSGNGILCMGMANKSHIAKNNITFNKKTGIHVMNSATVTILDNSISKNIFQGILIQENSSAHVERNKISSNIKANIAYGGEESCNTNIINNKITNGRCEGIFLIDCGKSMITRNEIKGNYYGILAITSIPTIMHNQVNNNKNHGIIMLKKSKIRLICNEIKDNSGVGVFIRDDSCVQMKDCIIDGNQLGVVQERKFNPKKHAKYKPVEDDELAGLDFSSNQALKSITKRGDDKEGLGGKQDENQDWKMDDFTKENTINDKLRVPFDVKCNLIQVLRFNQTVLNLGSLIVFQIHFLEGSLVKFTRNFLKNNKILQIWHNRRTTNTHIKNGKLYPLWNMQLTSPQAKRKEAVSDQLFGARLCYFTTHGFINLILLTYDCDLSIQISEGRYFYPLVYVLSTLFAAYAFLNAGGNPGIVGRTVENWQELDDSIELKEVEFNSDSDSTKIKSGYFNDGTNVEDQDFFQVHQNKLVFDEEDDQETFQVGYVQKQPYQSLDSCDQEAQKGTELSDYSSVSLSQLSYSSNSNRQSVTSESNYSATTGTSNEGSSIKKRIIPPKHECKRCRIVQPYRTRHCKACNACVAKFDHHCFWVGGCVGELNHGRFWIMLFAVFLEFLIAMVYSWSGMTYNSEGYEKLNGIKDKTYTKQYGAFFISFFIIIIFIFFVGLLFFYHSMLLLTNTTTWENTKAMSIDYLSVYPNGFDPFDEGLVKNLKHVFFNKGGVRNWKLPDIDEAFKNRFKKFNWRNNEYWKCC